MPRPVPAYLDYNATAPLRLGVEEAVLGALREVGNPSSVHGPGRAARARVEAARGTLARVIEVKPEEIIFTGGGTEAANLALRGLYGAGRFERILVGAAEHDAVYAPAQALGCPVEILPLTADGRVDLAALEAKLAEDGGTPFVAVMAANNETGVLQPVADCAALTHERGGLFFCDAVQGLGKIPLTRDSLGADVMSVSSHKIGGPQGVGALVLREGLTLAPLTLGGGQELGRRSGTENVAGVAGFAAALDALKDTGEVMERLTTWRDRIEEELLKVDSEIVIFGKDAPRLSQTLCFARLGMTAETTLMALDLKGVAVSSGAACSSGKVKASRVLMSMGADEALAACAIRVSMGWNSRWEECERFLEAWTDHHARVSKRGAAA